MSFEALFFCIPGSPSAIHRTRGCNWRKSWIRIWMYRFKIFLVTIFSAFCGSNYQLYFFLPSWYESSGDQTLQTHRARNGGHRRDWLFSLSWFHEFMGESLPHWLGQSKWPIFISPVEWMTMMNHGESLWTTKYHELVEFCYKITHITKSQKIMKIFPHLPGEGC